MAPSPPSLRSPSDPPCLCARARLVETPTVVRAGYRWHTGDGKSYLFLLKGQEDLRQDERVMQLFGLVNALLQSERHTLRFNLNIQRYAVMPLSNNSGLIGWVPNCDTMHELVKQYRESKVGEALFPPLTPWGLLERPWLGHAGTNRCPPPPPLCPSSSLAVVLITVSEMFTASVTERFERLTSVALSQGVCLP